ncbi:limonene-1,2-epoxide hydrolase family protein [Rhizobium binae]|uniref:limonene-1,2-epoxide hydrolase family protein n=1 Tax=Rhizobium binae TaxID=1138190 RepID=UPI002180C943|nr:limonene-1,2-epoxide hydrolase family protein [Rhizobium binae]
MSTDPTKAALTFFGHWNTGHIDEAIAMLSEEVLYDNVPFPNIVGRENVRKFHRDFGIGTTFTVDWTVTQIAAAGNVVLNERLDVFLHGIHPSKAAGFWAPRVVTSVHGDR